MNDRFHVKQLDNYRTLVINKQTGKEQVVIKDQKYREMEGRGDLLQPSDPRFFKKYPDMKLNYKGEVYNHRVELEKKEMAESQKEYENWKKEKANRTPASGGRKWF